MSKEKVKLIVLLLLLVVAFFMINIGILSGDVSVVETKSTNICMECIGIG